MGNTNLKGSDLNLNPDNFQGKLHGQAASALPNRPHKPLLP